MRSHITLQLSPEKVPFKWESDLKGSNLMQPYHKAFSENVDDDQTIPLLSTVPCYIKFIFELLNLFYFANEVTNFSPFINILLTRI